MSLELILGPSGSGKSADILSRVRNKLNQARPLTDKLYDKIIVLVPDQYTVYAESLYLEKLGAKAMPYIKILSMKRLASFVFTEFGIGGNRIVGGCGRNALMVKAIHSVKNHFVYYPSDHLNPRFMTLMNKTASDFSYSLIRSGELRRAAEELNDPKLLDISLCFEAYSAFIDNGFFDESDTLSVFAELICKYKLFCNSDIFCESYKFFTPQELKVLEAFLLSNVTLTVSLPAESRFEPRFSLFTPSGDCIRKLLGSVNRYDIKSHVTILKDTVRYKSKELENLQKNLFRSSQTSFEEKPEDIVLYKANDPFDEIEFVACKIKEAVNEQGYSYSDIMVVARESEQYASVIEPVFDRYGIPLFYHKKTPLKKKSVILFVRCLFDIVINGITREVVLDLLKTGLTGISVEDISLFENYTIQWGIDYDRFLKEFTLSVRGFSEAEDTDSDKRELQRINETRKKITDIMQFFKEKTTGKTKTVRKFSEAVYSVFVYTNLPQCLKFYEEEYEKYEEYELASEQKQVYEFVINFLDEIVITSGNDIVTAEEYLEIFMAAVESGNIGIIPVFSNAVIVGGAETTPYALPKIVFVIGLMNGTFPKVDSSVSVIDERDRILLEKYNISVGKSDIDKFLYERFLAYYAVVSPSEKLYLSYNVSESDSAPSIVINEIFRIYPKLEEKTFPKKNDTSGIFERFRNIDSAYEICKKYGINDFEEYFKSKGFFSNESPGKENLTKENAKAIFGANQLLSSSKVTNFYKCRFGYFFRYGMNLKKRRIAKLDAIETGNFIHSALNHAFKYGIDKSDNEMTSLMTSFTELYLKNIFGKESFEIGQKKHFEELTRRVLRLLKMFRSEISQTKFEPVFYELEVSEEKGLRPIRIPYNDGYVTMVGKIDRVDVYERAGEKFVRVIDYKSGNRSFNIEELYYGLDIQMLVYLYALSENGSEIFNSKPVPAGCMYINANPVTVSVPRNGDVFSAQREWESRRKRSGIFLNDPDVLRAMDPELDGKYIPVKENDLKSLATAEEFGKLFLKIRNLLKFTAEETSSGRIYKNPVRNGKIDACAYCDYSPYCEHSGCERSLGGVTYDNIYKLIDKELEGN